MNRIKNALTQKELAQRLGVSIGTVDRALHGRSGVSAEKREQILSLAKSLNYAPNPYARALVSNRRQTVIDVITPKHNHFWHDLLDGVKDASAKWKEYGLEVRFRDVLEGDVADELNAVRSVLDSPGNGMLVVPFTPHTVKDSIDRAIEAGVKVITVNRDCPACKRICYVGENPFGLGSLCALYYARYLKPGQQILVLSQIDAGQQLQERTEGFLDMLSAEAPNVTVAHAYYNNPQYEAYQTAAKALSGNSRPAAIFANTAEGYMAAAQAVLDAGQAGKCFMMGIDVTETALELLEKKAISFLVSQRPYIQGYLSMTKLCELLFKAEPPDMEFYHVNLYVFAGRAHYETAGNDLR